MLRYLRNLSLVDSHCKHGTDPLSSYLIFRVLPFRTCRPTSPIYFLFNPFNPNDPCGKSSKPGASTFNVRRLSSLRV
eukprot:m.68619 g.68619  ORF g.68619 m.68619 type:complete len:77 (+) comp50013_c0_seq31:2086-2316(+)